MSTSELRTKRGAWVLIIPISGLTLTQEVRREFRIHRVVLIERDKLSRVRKRFNIPHPISFIKKRIQSGWDILDVSKTFAIIRQTGQIEAIESKCLQMIKDELAILAMSRLGYTKRRTNAHIGFYGEENSNAIQYLFIDSKDVGQYGTRYGRIFFPERYNDLRLNAQWKNFHKWAFFFNFLKIITKQTKVDHAWRKTLCQAVILIGQSQNSHDKNQSFLWNMIALESLLTKQGDSYTEVLPKRLEAFIGWVGYWQSANYEIRIHEVYKKRCEFVHTGNTQNIKVEDVLFTDDLLFNVMSNIVSHINIFRSKDAIITFTKKVEAEHILGIPSKVRPKTLHFFSQTYREDDYKEI